jgi:hypothetical protein
MTYWAEVNDVIICTTNKMYSMIATSKPKIKLYFLSYRISISVAPWIENFTKLCTLMS